MRTLELAKATKPLRHFARNANKEPLIVTMDGKPLAAVVSLRNADYETVSLSNNPRFIALIERSRSRRRHDVGISPALMRERLGISKPSGARKPKRKAASRRA